MKFKHFKNTMLTLSVIAMAMANMQCSSSSTNDALVVTGASSATASSSTFLFKTLKNLLSPNSALAASETAGSPTLLQMNVYAFYISPNEDCSDAVLVDSNEGGAAVDFYSSPVMFSASPDAGDYPCVIIEMDDQITLQVDAEAAENFASCEVGSEYTGQIYRDGEDDDGLWVDTAGVGVDGTDGTDRIFIFATTNTDAAIEGPLVVNEHQVLSLEDSLTVPGSIVFYADFNDGVSGAGDDCGVEKGSFGFR